MYPLPLPLPSHKTIENSINKLRRLPATVPLGQLNRFVNSHPFGGTPVKHFVSPQPQNVTVRDGHPLQTPIVGPGGEELVDLGFVFAYAGQQRPGEVDQLAVVVQSLAQKAIGNFRIAIGIQVVLVEDLQDDLPGTAAASHSLKFALRKELSFLRYVSVWGAYRPLPL